MVVTGSLNDVKQMGPPTRAEQERRPTAGALRDMTIALRKRKSTQLRTLLKLLRNVFNPEALGDCAWIAIHALPDHRPGFWSKLGKADSPRRLEKLTQHRIHSLDYLSGKEGGDRQLG